MSPRQDHPENVASTQPENDDRDVKEYLQAVVDARIAPCTELANSDDVPSGYEGDESELYISEHARGQDGERRLRLRLKHPDSGETDISPRLTPNELDTFLRGLDAGVSGKISKKATLAGGDDQ